MKEQENIKTNGNGNGNGNLDFQKFISMVIQRKKTIQICLLVSIVTIMIVSLILPKKYESSAKILAEPNKDINPVSVFSKMFLETHKEILVSNTVIRKSISELSKRQEITITQDEINDFLKKVKVTSRSSLGKNKFSGDGIGESDIFFVSFFANSPQKAADSVNSLIKNYLKEAGRVRIEKAKAAIDIIESSVEATKKKCQELLKKMSEFEIKSDHLITELMYGDRASIRIFPEITNIRADYETLKAQIAKKRGQIDEMEKSFGSEKNSLAITSEVLGGYNFLGHTRNKISDLNFNLVEIYPYYSESSREIKSLQDSINEGENVFRNDFKQAIAGEKQSLSSLEKELDERKKTISEYDTKMTTFSKLNSEYALMRAEWLGLAKSLENQLVKLSDARIASADIVNYEAGVVVVDWGYPNKKPVSPNLFKNFIISIILGLLIGIIIVLFELMQVLPVDTKYMNKSNLDKVKNDIQDSKK